MVTSIKQNYLINIFVIEIETLCLHLQFVILKQHYTRGIFQEVELIE